MKAEPRPEAAGWSSIIFFEQPVKRQNAAREESRRHRQAGDHRRVDDSLDAFPRAKALGYKGVSSKTCKGIYKSLINRARCDAWGSDYFMSGEDLTIQPWPRPASRTWRWCLCSGLTHLERNGHHYVNGMADLSKGEQDAFLAAHPDLYERSYGAVRVKITNGELAIGSLACAAMRVPQCRTGNR
jgi:hypothetical protein